MDKELVVIMAGAVGTILANSLFFPQNKTQIYATLFGAVVAGLITWYINKKAEETHASASGY